MKSWDTPVDVQQVPLNTVGGPEPMEGSGQHDNAGNLAAYH